MLSALLKQGFLPHLFSTTPRWPVTGSISALKGAAAIIIA
jgi:hypothetical protein